jgi:hypothetical protein
MTEWRWSSTLLARRKIIRSYQAPAAFARLAGPGEAGKGRSGGFRVVYFFLAAPGRIYMSAIYAKSRMETLSAADRNVLAKLAAQIKRAAKGGR